MDGLHWDHSNETPSENCCYLFFIIIFELKLEIFLNSFILPVISSEFTHKCARDKAYMGYDQYTVPDDCSCRTYFCCSAFTFANISKHKSMASRAILSNFFDEQWTQNHPQYLSRLSRALFSTTFFEIAVSECISSRLSSQYSQLINYQHLNLNYLWTSYTKWA